MKKMMIALTLACGIAANNVDAGLWDTISGAASSVVGKISGAVSSAVGKLSGLAGSLIGKLTGSGKAMEKADKANQDVLDFNDAVLDGDTKEAKKQRDDFERHMDEFIAAGGDDSTNSKGTVLGEMDAALAAM